MYMKKIIKSNIEIFIISSLCGLVLILESIKLIISSYKYFANYGTEVLANHIDSWYISVVFAQSSMKLYLFLPALVMIAGTYKYHNTYKKKIEKLKINCSQNKKQIRKVILNSWIRGAFIYFGLSIVVFLLMFLAKTNPNADYGYIDSNPINYFLLVHLHMIFASIVFINIGLIWLRNFKSFVLSIILTQATYGFFAYISYYLLHMFDSEANNYFWSNTFDLLNIIYLGESCSYLSTTLFLISLVVGTSLLAYRELSFKK